MDETRETIAILGGTGAEGSALALRANSHLPTVGDAHLIEATLVALAVLVLAGLKAKQPEPNPV